MLEAALRAEVAEYLAAAAGERDEAGRALATRNGTARPREVTTVAGAVEVRAPRVNDRRVDDDSGDRWMFIPSFYRVGCGEHVEEWTPRRRSPASCRSR